MSRASSNTNTICFSGDTFTISYRNAPIPTFFAISRFLSSSRSFRLLSTSSYARASIFAISSSAEIYLPARVDNEPVGKDTNAKITNSGALTPINASAFVNCCDTNSWSLPNTSIIRSQLLLFQRWYARSLVVYSNVPSVLRSTSSFSIPSSCSKSAEPSRFMLPSRVSSSTTSATEPSLTKTLSYTNLSCWIFNSFRDSCMPERLILTSVSYFCTTNSSPDS